MPAIGARALLLITACSARLTVHADRIELTNGRFLDGVVVSQSAHRVSVDVGTGQVHLRPTQIARILTNDHAAVAADWQTRYFLHERFVPDECRDLAARLRHLQDQRRVAQAGRVERRRLHTEEERLRDAFDAGQAELAAHQARIAATDTNAVAASRAAWEDYARTIASFNAALARQDERRRAQQDVQQRVTQVQRNEMEYLRALDATDRQWSEFELPDPPPPAVTSFLAQARALLDSCRGEVQQTLAPVRWQGGQAVLEVEINGRASGRLLLDTGASTVVLAEALARRAGVQPDTNTTAQLTLADGRTVTGWPVFLDRVQVGDASALRVAAMVLPGSPAAELDGLLGMTFLREFAIQVDGPSGRVELQRLREDIP